MDFSLFDTRQYPVLEAEEGYNEWAETYERTVEDEMDLRLLRGLSSFSFDDVQSVCDLACGTGRIGAWLKQEAGVPSVEGIDLSPEMISLARSKEVYDGLSLKDLSDTGFDDSTFDLSISVLVDEHLSSLDPLYAEAWRITKPGGHFINLGFHPQFLMFGIAAHFRSPTSGETVSIRSYVHLLSDHIRSGIGAGFELIEMNEGVIDEDWLEVKPQWEKYLHRPVSYVFVWRKGQQ